MTEGEVVYQHFLEWSRTPGHGRLNVGSLVFRDHAITWFNLAPQAMVVKVAGKHVPGS